ncbi:GDSL-type esterase/lipase family protein [Roseibium sp. SCP14]|uniref:GDSL-type esterase/lipase family protein n=1 Tax=Roseibium sp. SCP14 TaxID=3141375 RepID=UPI00333D6C1A
MNRLISTAIIAASLLTASASYAADSARVLVFGDSNTWGWNPIEEGFPAGRHADDVRYGGVLDKALPNAKVVVDGFVGRRTNIDGRGEIGLVDASDFNGAKALPDSIARNMPLDLVVVMLGVNDLQDGVGRSPEEVAKAAFELAGIVQGSEKPVFTKYPAPKVLIVAPPALDDTSATPLSGLFKAGEEPSRQLGGLFAAEAERTSVPFFDASQIVTSVGVDGIHMTAENHKALGEALAPVVNEMLTNN